MKIDSPSSITSREASIRLEWISTRILPGVAVLLLSIPLCQWADSNLPDGIVPVSIIYLMIVIILWSTYMAVQYAFVGIAQTRKAKDKVTMENSNPHEEDGQAPVFLLEAMPIVTESNVNESICDAEVVEEIAEKTMATDSKVISEEANPDNDHPLFRSLLPVLPTSKALMTSTRVRLKARRKNWIPFMNIFYTSCLHLYMRKTWTSSAQTC
jgi:hypothetical protein